MNSKRLRVLGIILAVLALGTILLAACSRPGTVVGNGGGNGGTTPTATGGCATGTVHMTATNFAQNCVNIAKGSKLTLIDDVQIVHIITNGMWDSSGNTVLMKEPGAPTVPNVQIGGGSKDIGPFTTAGTFHIFCTIHTGMNLVVHVS